MPTGPAARVTDPTAHGFPLSPGPRSLNVMIRFLPAWRGVPAAAAAALQAANQVSDAAIQTGEAASALLFAEVGANQDEKQLGL
jgi:hypothetical protein